MEKTLSESIYEEIRRRILTKEYKANELVSEKALAKQFDVSKTPVREALNQLSQEGYVTRYPGFGYIIKELGYKDAKEICQLRFILESAAIRLAVESASDEDIQGLYRFIDAKEDSSTIGLGKNTTFHTELSRIAGNSHLMDDVARLAMLSMRPSSFDVENRPELYDQAHRQIVDAILAREAEKAIGLLRDDILSGKDGLFTGGSEMVSH